MAAFFGSSPWTSQVLAGQDDDFMFPVYRRRSRAVELRGGAAGWSVGCRRAVAGPGGSSRRTRRLELKRGATVKTCEHGALCLSRSGLAHHIATAGTMSAGYTPEMLGMAWTPRKI